MKTEEVRIWNEIELYKSGENSRAFLANNWSFLKQGLAGASRVEIYATGSQKSKSGDCYRRDANLFGIISFKNPYSLKPKLYLLLFITRKYAFICVNGNQQREDTFISAKKRTFAPKSDSRTIFALSTYQRK